MEILHIEEHNNIVYSVFKSVKGLASLKVIDYLNSQEKTKFKKINLGSFNIFLITQEKTGRI